MPIPLPAAVLALSVAVCIGSAGSAGASPMMVERASQGESRYAIEHLLDAIQQAAKKLTDTLVGQAVPTLRQDLRPVLALTAQRPVSIDTARPAVPLLRDSLLNLPPPTLG